MAEAKCANCGATFDATDGETRQSCPACGPLDPSIDASNRGSEKKKARTFSPVLFQAGWFLGRIRTDEVSEYAIEALENGFDGPALRRLAGMDRGDTEDVQRFIGNAFVELGLARDISRQDAGMIIARNIAGAIVAGEIHPYVGARTIWSQVYHDIYEPEQLLTFVGLASEYEDNPESRQQYEKDIIEAAKAFSEEH